MREDDEFWHYVPLLWTITAFAPDHHSSGGDHGGAGDRVYGQLEALEPEMRDGGMVYKCLPGQHGDLGISCAMLNWVARHPHLEWWMSNVLAARRPRRPRQTYTWAAFT
jgi:hypothetical protein